MERSIGRKPSGPGRAPWRRAQRAVRPRPRLVSSSAGTGRQHRRAGREPCRDRHRLRVRLRSREGGLARHLHRAACRHLRGAVVQGRRRPDDRRVLEAHDRAGFAFPHDGRIESRRLQGGAFARLRGWADAIVAIHVASTLSGTIKSAEIAKGMLPDREIHIVDSLSASMGEGALAELGVEMANSCVPAAEIASVLTRRRDDIGIYLALDTLEYLKRGGRISGARAAIGTLLSVKPIIEVKNGEVGQADKVRTRGRARERLIELLTARPIERLSILHTTEAGVEEFAEQLMARADGLDRSKATIDLVGASVGPHVGPGCVGGVALWTEGSKAG